ncbi:hypothetical protein [Methanofollis ethanolicus]|uniref:hypothetical protein n=1 Tax=Methanofollis ethanolicus TaxID=488124 RepID=UPI00128F3611|nr:hypothetical protein [Methanofollis ethanolicus]
MIRPILCEGRYDSWFLDEILKIEYAVLPIRLHSDFKSFSRYYRWGCRDGKPCIILSDNGHDLISKYIPKIIREYFAAFTPLNLHYVVLKDSDGSNHRFLLGNYYDTISEIIRAKNMNNVDFDKNEDNCTITLTSKQDSRHSFQFHFIFIPQSFEKSLVAKSFEKNRQLSKYKDDIERMDPHDALTEIAKHLGIDKESLIRNSVSQGWFREEDWYMTLGQSFCDYLNFSPYLVSIECSG